MAGRRLLYRRTWLQRLNPGGGAENRQNEKLWISFCIFTRLAPSFHKTGCALD